ncbi:Putative peptidoglycan binding domain 1 [Alloactinosynnema sp. L-07]|uniref:peptidoglycan-binding protein n=1 Tax=Alloactinosynnema sp. L-07 TaxID=1653480 RepID=UPI00065EFAC6|nr:peptidoglycan-binding protein [Alloactinosynnema sp. L-07]CRK57180.1 Putative peptidoglycan binding domain 1 [Alloactinosynnema sp. L-07]
MRGRTRWVAGVTVLVLAGGGAAAAATGFGFDDKSGDDGKKDTKAPSIAKVGRQTLVDTERHSGDLGFGDAATVSGRLNGTVTGLPATGSTVDRGQALYQVDNTPVVLMFGGLPAYRALASGTEGADVKQFEDNLAALGYKGFTVDEKFSDATATAVKKWQDDLGLTETGVVDLGRVVYTTGAVRVDAHKLAVGDELRPGTALLTYTGLARVVTVSLDVSDQRLAVKDAAVTITLPNGKSVGGKIIAVATVIEAGEGGMGSDEPTTKIEVTVAIDDPAALTGLDQAAVDVGFTAAKRENVLTVPVAALLALAEGGYGVQVVDGSATRIVAVTTGMFAGGRVEVTGDGLAEGVTVGVPS